MKYFILFVLSLICQSLSAQKSELLISEKGGQFFKDGLLLTSNELKNILKTNTTSATEYNKYISSLRTGKAVTAIGGVLDAVSLVLILSGTKKTVDSWGMTHTEYNSNITTPGYIIAGVGIITSFAGLIKLGNKKHLKSAVEHYNNDLNTSKYFPTKYKPEVCVNGIGLILKF
jgi:hypothetical protein